MVQAFFSGFLAKMICYNRQIVLVVEQYYLASINKKSGTSRAALALLIANSIVF